MIAIADYGSGNVRSVHRALVKAGAEVRLVREPRELEGANGMVLPGVGAFDDCINALNKQELLAACHEFIASGRPFLGICVGYQALFERSHEFNSCAAGLGLFKGEVVRLQDAKDLKVPQIGWNQIEIVKPDCPLYKGIPDGSYVYFVHSFFPRPKDDGIVATRSVYGESFASSIWKDNLFATQFHPEKSQKIGLRMLQNFVALAESPRAQAAIAG